MSELTTRPATPEDAAEIAEFLNVLERAVGGEDGWAEGEIRSFFGTWIQDGERDTRLLLAADSSIVGFGMIAAPEGDNTRADTLGGIHPDWRGRGLGRELFAWQIDRLTEAYAERGPGIEWELDAGVNVNDTSAAHLFERFGFEVKRYYIEMVAPTAGAAVVPFAEGVTVVPFDPERKRELYTTQQEVWQDYWGYQPTSYERWIARTVDAETFRPDLSRLALANGEIVAFVLSHDSTEGRIYVSHVGTRRDWRRKGLAAALLVDVLAQAGDLGYESASLGANTDSPTGAVGVYERAGFRVHTTFAAYRRKL